MTNKNVIEIIDRLIKCRNAGTYSATPSEVFTAIVHGYYYIRPGKNTYKFLNKISKLLDSSWKDKSKICLETTEGCLSEVQLMGKLSGEALYIARSMFDKEYYESQVARMVMHEKYDESLLERYLYWLDEAELKSVFEGLLTFKRDFDVFISDSNFDRMMDELKVCSMIIIEDDPWYSKDYNKHVDYIDNNWDFCFEYLTRETIIGIICRYANENPVMLASMVKTFKYADIRSASEYTGLAIWLSYGFEVDVFESTITDVEQINSDNCDNNLKTVIYNNKTRKFTVTTEVE
jgi:hypothetical protein